MAHARPHIHAHADGVAHVHRHAPAPAFRPGFSLLRLSAVERLAGAAAVAALIWAGVWWALH
jgi:hypothetical protein